jgi:hypothetical protein
MRRFTASLIFATLLLLIAAAPAGAWGVTWCRVDPIVLLNGTQVSILVAVPEEYAPYVNGPIDVVVRVPAQVRRELIMTDAGFNGYGETVTFIDTDGEVNIIGGFDTVVRVTVPIDRVALGSDVEVPVEVTIDPGYGLPMHVEYGTDARTRAVIQVRSNG